MFNEQQKSRYIQKKESETTLAPGFLANIFAKSAPFEEKRNKDLCEWTTAEITDYYKYLDVYSYESLSLMNSNYSQYTNWALTETLVPDGQNHYLEMNPDALMKCVNTFTLGQTIITRDALIEYADQVKNYTDRFVFYALFEGIAGELFSEITQARLGDIDMAAKAMKLCTGRVVNVSGKLIDVARWAAEEDYYRSYGVQERVHPYREEGTDVIFKTIAHKEGSEENDLVNKAQVLSRRYIKSLESVGLPRTLTPKRLMMSGKLHYIKGIVEKEGIPVEELLLKRGKEIDERYPVEKAKSTLLFMKKWGKYFA